MVEFPFSKRMKEILTERGIGIRAINTFLEFGIANYSYSKLLNMLVGSPDMVNLEGGRILPTQLDGTLYRLDFRILR